VAIGCQAASLTRLAGCQPAGSAKLADIQSCSTRQRFVFNIATRCLCYVLGIWRTFAVVFFSVCALVQNAISIPFVRCVVRLRARAAWLQRWCRFACLVLGIRVRTRGSMPSSGLLVSNHLSYLDIIVLSSIRPCVFVAKCDVARWPLFGWLARAAGTIFVDRDRRFCGTKAIDLIRQAIAGGSLVVLFPEGTGSDRST